MVFLGGRRSNFARLSVWILHLFIIILFSWLWVLHGLLLLGIIFYLESRIPACINCRYQYYVIIIILKGAKRGYSIIQCPNYHAHLNYQSIGSVFIYCLFLSFCDILLHNLIVFRLCSGNGE